MLAVSEIYGPVLQGEGRYLGEPTLFLRLMGCNLKCTWCDTAYTWDSSRFKLKDELTKMSEEEVGEQLRILAITKGVENVDISGGEPLLQQEALYKMICTQQRGFLWWSVETAGTLVPSREMLGAVDAWNVSPKLESSGNGPERINREALNVLHLAGADFKFVASTEEDLREVDNLRDQLGINRSSIYIMPEGVTPEAILSHSRLLEPHVIKRGYNLTTRLHILLHGDERGV